MRKYIIICAIAVISVLALIISFTRGNFDVLRTTSVSSFNDLMVSDLKKERKDNAWTISMPDQTSKLALNVNNNETSIVLSLDIRPFLKAGLNINKLPTFMTYNIDKKELYISANYGSEKIDGDAVAIANVYKNIVTTYRDKLSYHHTLDHFGLSLDNGNVFEYAKNINDNDKDIVIALNPKVFEEASVDVTKVEGYKYTDVVMKDGSSLKKLLKIFNLEEVTQCSITNTGC